MRKFATLCVLVAAVGVSAHGRSLDQFRSERAVLVRDMIQGLLFMGDPVSEEE